MTTTQALSARLIPNVLTPGPGRGQKATHRDYWLRPLELELSGIDDEVEGLKVQLLELDKAYGEGSSDQVIGELEGSKRGLRFEPATAGASAARDLVGIDLKLAGRLATAGFRADEREGLRAELQLRVLKGGAPVFTSPSPALIHLGPVLPLLDGIGNAALAIRGAIAELSALCRDLRSSTKNLRRFTKKGGILDKLHKICKTLKDLRKPLIVGAVALSVCSGGVLAAVAAKVLRLIAKVLNVASALEEPLKKLRARARIADPKLKRAEESVAKCVAGLEKLPPKLNRVEAATLLLSGDVKALNCVSRREPLVRVLFDLHGRSAPLPALCATAGGASRKARAVTGPVRKATAVAEAIEQRADAALDALGRLQSACASIEAWVPDLVEALIEKVGWAVETVIGWVESGLAYIPFVGRLYKDLSEKLHDLCRSILGFLGDVSRALSGVPELLNTVTSALAAADRELEGAVSAARTAFDGLQEKSREAVESIEAALKKRIVGADCFTHLLELYQKKERAIARADHWQAKVQCRFLNVERDGGHRVVLELSGIPESDGTRVKVRLMDCNHLNEGKKVLRKDRSDVLVDADGAQRWTRTVDAGAVRISTISDDLYTGDVLEEVQELYPSVELQEPGADAWTVVWEASHYQPVAMKNGRLARVVAEDKHDS